MAQTDPLDEILIDLVTRTAKQITSGTVPPGTAAKFVEEARAAIIKLVRGTVVGEDEKLGGGFGPAESAGMNTGRRARNYLRTHQNAILDGWLKETPDGK